MIKQLRNIFNWIVFSNIFVAFCVLALTISSEVLLDTANFRISQFVFFATLFTYNFQRVVKLKQRGKQLKTDWQATTGARYNTHNLYNTAGDLFGQTVFTDPYDGDRLLAHSSYQSTWPNENELF